jgi:hypothetical protein
MYEEDLSSAIRVLPPARDVAAAAIARSDLDTWSHLVSAVREGLTDTLVIWDKESGGLQEWFTNEVRSFVEFLLESSQKHGHLSASEDVTRMTSHLLTQAVRWHAELPASELVIMVVRQTKWCLDRRLTPQVESLVQTLAKVAALKNSDPWPDAAAALKQVGEWIARAEPVEETFAEFVYYSDPFASYVEALHGLLKHAATLGSMDLISEIGLACEVTLARAWAARSCHEIIVLAVLTKDTAVAAAKLGGDFGYYIALPAHNLREAYDALIGRGCDSEANELVEMIAQIAANGFRDGLDSQFGPFPGAMIVEYLDGCPLDAVTSAAKQIYTRGHYGYIPEGARRRFVRAVQERRDDLLGFSDLVPIEDTEGDERKG